MLLVVLSSCGKCCASVSCLPRTAIYYDLRTSITSPYFTTQCVCALSKCHFITISSPLSTQGVQLKLLYDTAFVLPPLPLEVSRDATMPRKLSFKRNFQYSTLEPYCIYLLEMLPDMLDGHIQVRLYENKLPALYQCLSYTWGEPDDVYEVLVNSRAFFVGKILHDFLEIAMDCFPNQPLWIDALYIDQHNDQGRSHQVQHMDEIYRGAVCVLIWLVSIDFKPISCLPGSDWYDHLSPSYKDDVKCKPILGCVLHAYWNRTWILQEVPLAKKVFILHNLQEVGLDIPT